MEVFERQAWIHIVLKDWGVGVYKEILHDLIDLKDALRSKGMIEMVALGTDKTIKLISMFGFTPEGVLMNKDTGYVEHYLMVQEL